MSEVIPPRPARRPEASALLAYLGGLAKPAPRVVRFMLSERKLARAGQNSAGRPAARLTPGLVALAALDEWTVAFMKTPGRMPTPDGYVSAAAELMAAHEFYKDRGWIEDPSSFHVSPPALEDPRIVRRRFPGVPFEHMTFPSGYEPDPEDPGRDRWVSHEPNKTAHAWVLRHPESEDRPWIVCLHAFGMGYHQLDLWGFRAAWLHRTLGLNVILPVAPLHGPRRIGRLSGAAFMSYNLVDIVHGFAQAVWDTRRVLNWVRASGGETVGVYGVSMGAHLAALLAGLDPDLSFVLSAFPTCNLTELFVEHGPRQLRRRATEHRLLGQEADEVHRLVSPLAFTPRPPVERLFICAGLADRMATPAQAIALWTHWGKPRIQWLNTNHVAFLWSGEVGGFVREVLSTAEVV